MDHWSPIAPNTADALTSRFGVSVMSLVTGWRPASDERKWGHRATRMSADERAVFREVRTRLLPTCTRGYPGSHVQWRPPRTSRPTRIPSTALISTNPCVSSNSSTLVSLVYSTTTALVHGPKATRHAPVFALPLGRRWTAIHQLPAITHRLRDTTGCASLQA